MSKAKRVIQSGKTVAITSRNISRKRFCIDSVGKLSDWELIRKYRCKLSVVDTAEEGFTVSAKKLHKALESKQQFSHWIAYRITQAGFEEGQDYLKEKFISQMRGKAGSIRSVEMTEYQLTPNAAKELAMMESTAVGKLVRRYFILCEKIVKTYILYNQTRAEAFTNLDKRLKHRLAQTKQGVDFINVVHREVCVTITGWTPSEWENKTGERPRDALSMPHKQLYLTGYEFLVANVESKTRYVDALAKLQKSKVYKIDANKYLLKPTLLSDAQF